MQPSSPGQPEQKPLPEESSSPLSQSSERLTIEPLRPIDSTDIDAEPVQPKVDVSSIYPTIDTQTQIHNSQITAPIGTVDVSRRRKVWKYIAIFTALYILFLAGPTLTLANIVVDLTFYPLINWIDWPLSILPFIILIIAIIQFVRLRPSDTAEPHNGSPTNLSHILNVILAIVLAGLVICTGLIAAIYIFATTCQGTACGDAILFIFAPMEIIAGLILTYYAVDMFYIISQAKHHMPIAKKHLILGVLLSIVLLAGLAWKVYDIVTLATQKAQYASQFEKSGGPTDAQKARFPLGSLVDAKTLVNNCTVDYIYVLKYDLKGPAEAKNEFIVVDTQALKYGVPTPNRMFLPVSDWSAISAAAAQKNKNLTGPYESCARKIILTPTPPNT